MLTEIDSKEIIRLRKWVGASLAGTIGAGGLAIYFRAGFASDLSFAASSLIALALLLWLTHRVKCSRVVKVSLYIGAGLLLCAHTLDVTEHVPALDDVPILGSHSEWNGGLNAIGLTLGLILVFIALMFAVLETGFGRIAHERYRLLADNVNDFIWVIDTDLNGIYASPSVEKLRGYTSEEAVKQRIDERLTHESAEHARKVLSREIDRYYKGEIKADDSITLELEFTTKDGSSVWAETNTRLLVDDDGRVTGVLGVSRDISERRSVEAELRKSEARFRSIIEDQSEFIVRWKPGGTRTFVNDSYCRHYGITREQAIGTSFLQHIPEEARKEVEDRIAKLSPENPISSDEHEVVLPDGTIGWNAWTDRALFDENGDLIEYQSVGRDITERKRAEQASHESEARLVRAQKIAKVGDFTWDVNTGEIKWSKGLYYLTGYKETDGVDFARVQQEIHAAEDKERIEQWIADALESKSPVLPQNEYRVRRKNGDTFYVRTVGEIEYRDTGPRVFATVQDITETKLAERALRESQERFRLIFESAPDAVFLIGTQGEDWGRIVAANATAAKQHGYTPEELVGLLVTNLDDPESAKLVPYRMQRLLAGEQLQFEIEHRRKDGSLFPVEVTASCVDVDGVPHILAFDRDISERKRNERVFDAIFEGTAGETGDEFFNVFTQKLGEVLRVKYALVGQLEDSNRVQTVSVWAGHEHAENFVYGLKDTPCQNVMRTSTCFYPSSVTAQFPNDDLLVQMGVESYMGTPLQDSDGTTVGILVVMDDKPMDDVPFIRNVLEVFAARAGAELARIRAVKAMRESEAGLREAQHIAHLGSWFWDLEHGQVRWSDEMYDIYDLDPADGPGTELVRERIIPEDRHILDEALAATERGEIYDSIEYRILKKDGSIAHIVARANVERDESGKPLRLLGTAQDITEQKQAKLAQEALQEQLNQAQKLESIGRLAGGVAHDFNNMLEVILGHADLAIDTVDDQGETAEHMQEIKGAAARAADLVRQLLAFARQQPVAPEVLDLNHSIGGMFKMLTRLIGEDIRLVWQPGDDLWRVHIDPSQIDQILANLCVNARDAVREGGEIHIETHNVVLDDPGIADRFNCDPGDYVEITVSDNGCGIDSDTQHQIFEPFYTSKDQGKGTGLGLATVYGIVRQNRGYITVDSEPGEGTTFHVRLPRRHGPIEARPSAAGIGEMPKGSETILLVEDEPAILQLASKMLQRLGYDVMTAPSPSDAIKTANEYSGTIDLLVTDVVMPGMNGRDLAGQLLNVYPNMKQLFMSGYSADLVANDGVLPEGINFIQKPFGIHDFAAKVRSTIDSGSPVAK